MNVIPTRLPGVLILEPKVFEDTRGLFYESFNARTFAQETGVTTDFVQDNHSESHRGVLRGLHYQVENAQAKLVRITHGEVLDVVVDVRRSSATFGQWIALRLSAANRRQLWVPESFAHGFLVLSDRAEFQYKTTTYFNPSAERCIRWDDPDLAIDWPLDGPPILSAKDQQGQWFRDSELLT